MCAVVLLRLAAFHQHVCLKHAFFHFGLSRGPRPARKFFRFGAESSKMPFHPFALMRRRGELACFEAGSEFVVGVRTASELIVFYAAKSQVS